MPQAPLHSGDVSIEQAAALAAVAARVIYVSLALGSHVVSVYLVQTHVRCAEIWFRFGSSVGRSDVVSNLFRFGSGLAHNLFRFWSSTGSGLIQVWVRLGSDWGPIRIRTGL